MRRMPPPPPRVLLPALRRRRRPPRGGERLPALRDPSAALEPRTGAPIGSDLASANAEIGSSAGSTSDADAAG